MASLLLDSVLLPSAGEPVARRLTLTEARLRKLWSTTQLSKESGVALTTILDIERGIVKRPRLDTIERLSHALDVAPSDIEWPGNPLELYNPRTANAQEQVIVAALIFRMINEPETTEEELRRKFFKDMEDLGRGEDYVQSAWDLAQAIVDDYKQSKSQDA